MQRRTARQRGEVRHSTASVPLAGMVIEQTLGHVTHGRNLQRLLGSDRRIDAHFIPVDFAVDGWRAKVPGFGNWTIRSGIRSRRALTELRRTVSPDVLFFHTQVPAVLNQRMMRRTPAVISLDATPRQYDELGATYAHEVGSRASERLKFEANRRCFRRAAALVAWAAWTRDGLVNDYGIDADRIHVIPPGVDTALWTSPPRTTAGQGGTRILFVGGDLARKGGNDLIAAVRRLRDHGYAVSLDLVTTAAIEPSDGIRPHHGVSPNSPELIELYRAADVFCLPTHGDCLPMVLPEAGVMGLPLVSTSVGAITEVVRDGETGLLVPPNDITALTVALRRLVEDGDLQRRLGTAAEALIRAEHDAAKNAARLAELLVDTAGTP